MEEVALRRVWREKREAARDVAAARGASVVASAPSGKACCCGSEWLLDSVGSAGLGGGAMFSVAWSHWCCGARSRAVMTAAIRAVDSVGATTEPLASAQWCEQPYGRWRSQRHRQA